LLLTTLNLYSLLRRWRYSELSPTRLPQPFAVSVTLPSGRSLALWGNLRTDPVEALGTRLAQLAELQDSAFFIMHGTSCLTNSLTLEHYNVQQGSVLRILPTDVLPGGAPDYVSTHQDSLESALSIAINELLRAKPADPLRFVSQRLAVLSNEAGEVASAAAPLSLKATERLPLRPVDGEQSGSQWTLLGWLAGAGLHHGVAGAIQHALTERGRGANDEEALAFIRGLGDRDAVASVMRTPAMTAALINVVWDEVKTLQSQGAATTSAHPASPAASMPELAATKAKLAAAQMHPPAPGSAGKTIEAPTLLELSAEHIAHAKRLGVSDVEIHKLEQHPPEACPSGKSSTVRVMTWNVLADGLSDDGFLVRDVLSDPPGVAPPFVDLVQEVARVRQKGSTDAMVALAAKHSTQRARENHAIVMNFHLRWLRIRTVIAACFPDIIAFQVSPPTPPGSPIWHTRSHAVAHLPAPHQLPWRCRSSTT
jgi:hypothetical protein